MQSNIIECSVCEKQILKIDTEIKDHLLSHEHEWIQTLRSKYEV